MDFLVKKNDLREVSFEEEALPKLTAGQVRLRIKKFALTANNVTYGAAGDLIGYWNFFPAEHGWGRIPVWGIAAVDESNHPDLEEGERLYGYLPMSTDLVIAPDKITKFGLIDSSEHRASLPIVYNQYTRLAAEPGYDRADDDRRMLLNPLFMTSFLIDDFLADNDLFGARTILLASASSKTAFSLAYLLSKNGRGKVVGLTSSGNREFVQGLGCYDEVVSYDAIARLPAGEASVLVDMAGDAGLLRSVHEHLGDALKHSCQVGMTHWEARGSAADLPGPSPAFFFAPSQIEKRRKDWGASGFQQRAGDAWRDFLSASESWLKIVHGRGAEAVERVYLASVDGRVSPSEGHILSLE